MYVCAESIAFEIRQDHSAPTNMDRLVRISDALKRKESCGSGISAASRIICVSAVKRRGRRRVAASSRGRRVTLLESADELRDFALLRRGG